MLKRLIACVFALLIFTNSALALITQKEAENIIYGIINEKLGYEPEDLSMYHSGYDKDNDTWACAFHLKEYDAALCDGLVVVMLSGQGELKSFQEPRNYTPSDLIMNSLKKDDYTIESMAAWREEWRPRINELDGRRMGEYIRLLEMGISLPKEGAVSKEEALQTARAAIAALPGWTEDKLDMLNLYIQVYYQSEELGKPVYQFIFSRVRSSSGKYINRSYDYYQKNYLKPLYKQFGGDNLSTPLYVSLRIDAMTGLVAEAPMVSFPPMECGEFEMIR